MEGPQAPSNSTGTIAATDSDLDHVNIFVLLIFGSLLAASVVTVTSVALVVIIPGGMLSETYAQLKHIFNLAVTLWLVSLTALRCSAWASNMRSASTQTHDIRVE